MLTDLQAQVLRCIIHHQADHHGVTPTYRMIASSLGLKSTSAVHAILVALERDGCIRRLPRKAQAIEVLPLGHDLLREAA